MWIKLISPRFTVRPMDSAFKTHMAPPLSLLVLGALTPRHHRVSIEDENIETLHLNDKPDLVGITVKADTALRAYEIADVYRNKGIKVVFGGLYPTMCLDDVYSHADSIVMGEAEEIWPDLVRDFEANQLRKLYAQVGPIDLALSPIPRWDLLKGKNYLYTNTLTISRGCPWKCDFCYNSSPNLPKGHRMKPIQNILAEIRSLPTNHVMFIDDNFIGSPDYARQLVREMKKMNLTWHAAVSADIGHYDDLIDMMAESGCKSLFIGFETVNQRSLLNCGKRQNRVIDYDVTVAKIHRREMMINASIVFGFDTDGKDVFQDTVGWLIDKKIASMTAHILTPYPGTKLHQQLMSENRIIDFDLRHYNTSYVVYKPKNMDPDELREGYLKAYDEFYSWSNIIKRLPVSNKQKLAFLAFNILYRKYGKIWSVLGRLGLMGTIGRFGKMLAYPERRRKLKQNPEPVFIPQRSTT